MHLRAEATHMAMHLHILRSAATDVGRVQPFEDPALRPLRHGREALVRQRVRCRVGMADRAVEPPRRHETSSRLIWVPVTRCGHTTGGMRKSRVPEEKEF